MRRTILALAALSTALVALPAQAEPVVLEPSSPWNVNFGEDKCRLAGFFGEGDDRHTLIIEQFWPGQQFGLTIAGPGVRNFRSLKQAQVRFADGLEPVTAIPFTGSLGELGTAVIFSTLELDKSEREVAKADYSGRGGLPQLDPALGQKVQFIELLQNGRSVRLETGTLKSAFDVLNQCTAGLLREWGLDPEQHLTRQNGPRWINKDALTRRIVDSYPRGALVKGEQGIMRMRAIVSAEGTVESCTILKATITKDLESSACKVMETAQFKPARDAAGQPFRSLYVTSITYRIGS